MHINSACYCKHSCEPNSQYAPVKLDCSDVVVVFVTGLGDMSSDEEVTVDYNWGVYVDTPNVV